MLSTKPDVGVQNDSLPPPASKKSPGEFEYKPNQKYFPETTKKSIKGD
jgi:hypothetical protein